MPTERDPKIQRLIDAARNVKDGWCSRGDIPFAAIDGLCEAVGAIEPPPPTPAPGPWQVRYDEDEEMYSVMALTCRPLHQHVTTLPDCTARSQANAILMAAAPELLDALRVAVRVLEDFAPEQCDPADEAITMGRAAIAKATGMEVTQ